MKEAGFEPRATTAKGKSTVTDWFKTDGTYWESYVIKQTEDDSETPEQTPTDLLFADADENGYVPIPFAVGERVRLTEDVERYPLFILRKGSTGTVDEVRQPGHQDGPLLSIKMDETIVDDQGENVGEQWDNCLLFSNEDCLAESLPDTGYPVEKI